MTDIRRATTERGAAGVGASGRHRTACRARPPRWRGFTFVELMVAIAIFGVLATIANATYQSYRERMDVAKASTGLAAAGALVDQYFAEYGRYPPSLADVKADGLRDAWGNAYQYVSHDDPAGKGHWRKDHNIVPINSDYDLWSMGKDGKSSPPLTAAGSRDDVVRANNGRFFGLASVYDP